MNKKEVAYIQLDGTQLITKDSRDIKIVAKCQINPWNKKANYYIRFENGRMVRPLDRDIRRRVTELAQWRKVPEIVYNLYLKFLQTNKVMFLSQAERAYHE